MVTGSSRFDVVGQLPALRRYARVLTRDDTEAEELIQDALVRAYERRATFEPGRGLRGWLLSILHNRFIDRMRSAQGREGPAGRFADDVQSPSLRRRITS